MKYRIVNERTGKSIIVSGVTIRSCQLAAAKKSEKLGWEPGDNYRSEPVESIFRQIKRSNKNG